MRKKSRSHCGDPLSHDQRRHKPRNRQLQTHSAEFVGGEPSRLAAFLCALAAAALTAVLLIQITRPGSMIGAFTRIELSGVDRDTVGTRFRQRIQACPTEPQRRSVEALLKLVQAVRLGHLDASTASARGFPQVAADVSNLVSRVAYAVLSDLNQETAAATASTSAPATFPPSPRDRFEKMRDIVEGGSPVDRAEFHIEPLLEAWRLSLEFQFTRSDVESSVGRQPSKFMPGDLRTIPWTVWPALNAHVLSLARELREAGHIEEAAACEHWVAACAIGILKSQRDAPTRLMAARLLADATAFESPAVARSAREFHSDFLAATELADVDYCEQADTNLKSAAPVEYRRAVMWLMATGAAAMTGVGAAITLVLSLLLVPFFAIIRSIRGRYGAGPATISQTAGLPSAIAVSLKWLIFLSMVLVTAASFAFAFRFWADQAFSASMLIQSAMLSLATGGAFAVTFAGLRRSHHRRGLIGLLAFAAAMIVWLAMPFQFHAWTARRLALSLGSEFVLVPIVTGIVATVAILGGLSLRRLIAGAAATWLTAAAIAMMLFAFHSAADRRYQQEAVIGHRDEVAARLGADWATRYFAEAFRRYDLKRP